MSSEHPYHPQQKPQKEKHFWRTPPGVIALIIIVIIGYYLITEHGAHIASLLGASPFLLLILLCPLMHLFMHKGHGGGKHHHKSDDEEDNNSSENKE
ncbi:DUF2933 domain-containing protein [Legionella fallonii]|uniref:DUF2933 domain-containing protein n=1 Tax=Legionella fallonii LLAP-10 TaxID=1212491 RepID=A0A098GCF4_9GAMM|nr:DUF2933 domain-containing protein [Legionella fallonii]CEG59166.1 conserved protein of unknown function [Legionella fallonii LLAP-10]